MDIIVLAAGYATRLYPLTLDKPKALLEVAGKPMINHVLDQLATISEIKNVWVVTNAKFHAPFETWARTYKTERPNWIIEVINDHSTDENNRLGAIGDMRFVIEQKRLKNDLIVVAGDNLFSQSLEDFGTFCQAKKTPVLAVYDVKNLEAMQKYGVVSLSEKGTISAFEEKPKQPKSTLAGIALYYYPASTLGMVEEYLKEGNNPDQPGRLIQWLYPKTDVYCWNVPGIWFDVGSHETLSEANEVFSKFTHYREGVRPTLSKLSK